MSSKYLNYEIKMQISNTQNSVNDCAYAERERERERKSRKRFTQTASSR